MYRSKIRLFLVLLTVPLVSTVAGAEPKFDIVIKHGRIVDGSGAPWYEADVGILDGRIVRIESLATKKRRPLSMRRD